MSNNFAEYVRVALTQTSLNHKVAYSSGARMNLQEEAVAISEISQFLAELRTDGAGSRYSITTRIIDPGRLHKPPEEGSPDPQRNNHRRDRLCRSSSKQSGPCV